MTRTALSGVILALAALAAGCGSSQNNTNDGASREGWPETQTQQPAGAGAVTFALRDAAGNFHSADEWIGKKPVIINFWGTWCGPCRREIPDMVKVYDEYRGRVEILGIAMNDTPEKVEAFRKQFGMNWVMLMGDAPTAVKFGVQGIPTTFFLDAKGNIVQVEDSDGSMAGHFVGPRDYGTFKRAIETILHASEQSS